MTSIHPNIEKLKTDKDYRIKSVDAYVYGIVEDFDPLILSEAITMLESQRSDHREMALEILISCYSNRVSSRRIGITGSPGVGKSTFIESFGCHLMEGDHRLGVLTIDPSGILVGGSILGDQTRMNQLSMNANVFIRQSPAGDHLGGIHKHSFETIALCEASGMDHLIIETVGVGQSEHEISTVVDCNILLIHPSSGDQLQGIKRGIVEIADILIVHKADGDRAREALNIKKEYALALNKAHHRLDGWEVPIICYSSLYDDITEEVVPAVDKFFGLLIDTGEMELVRSKQENSWLQNEIRSIVANKAIEQFNSKFGDSILNKTEPSEEYTIFDKLKKFVSKLDISLTLK